HRADPTAELTDGGRQYRGMTLMELGRSNLESNGIRTGGMSRMELAGAILNRQMGTSDLPAGFGAVAHRSLRAGYEGADGSHRKWMRKTTAADFRSIERIQLSARPRLLQVPEGGEFKMGSLSDSKEVYALATFGRIVPFTRQSLINDDLDALSRIP